MATLVPLAALSFWIGLYPAPVFRVLEEPVARLVQQVDKTYVYPTVALPAAAGEAPPAVAERR